jgi:hypothetical protein
LEFALPCTYGHDETKHFTRNLKMAQVLSDRKVLKCKVSLLLKVIKLCVVKGHSCLASRLCLVRTLGLACSNHQRLEFDALTLLTLEAAEFAKRKSPSTAMHAVLVNVNAGAEVATADALDPLKTHDCDGAVFWCV